jgi:hypothetical protein
MHRPSMSATKASSCATHIGMRLSETPSKVRAQTKEASSAALSTFCTSGSIGGESHLGTTLVLLFGSTCDGDRAHDVATLHYGQRSPAGHDATAA